MDIHKIHDSFVREVLSKKEEAISFFNALLPKEITEHLDLNNLEVEDGTFIDDNFRQYYSDILFKVPVKNGNEGSNQNLYLLFEHKSYPDKKIHLQLLKYISEIHSKQEELMPVIPVVFYHGKEKWKLSERFSEMFPENIRNSGLTEFLDFRYYLVDLNKIDTGRLQISLTLAFFLGIMKNIDRSNFEEVFSELLEKVRELFSSRDNAEFLHKMFLYIYNTTEITKEKLGAIVEVSISREAKEIAMTTAEKLIKEGEIRGELRGKLEGKLEDARKMLAKGADLEFIFDITGLSEEDLKKAGVI